MSKGTKRDSLRLSWGDPKVEIYNKYCLNSTRNRVEDRKNKTLVMISGNNQGMDELSKTDEII